ncbi:MAG: ATP--guanido phosphotransferase, partial [Elusimicrobiota bacterium]
MQLANMLRFKMGWAVPSGPHHEIVLSSRIRLARNLRGHPFPNRAAPKALAAVLREVFDGAQKTKPLAKAAHLLLDEVDELDRLFLVERR